jgi:seryl-tRNA synthetase
MLQVSYIRQNRDLVIERLGVKNFGQTELVVEVIALDVVRKKLQASFDNTQARVNSASKEIGMLMRQGQKEQAEGLKTEVASLKTEIEPLKGQMAAVEKTLQDRLLLMPNLPANTCRPRVATLVTYNEIQTH